MIRKVVHFIDTSEFGGAEQSLLSLLAGLDRAQWEPVLFCHTDPGIAPLRDGAERLGVRVRTVPRLQGAYASSLVGARAREVFDAARGLPRFLAGLHSERPAVFHAHLNWPLACKWGLLAAASDRVPAIVATVQLFADLPHPFVQRVQYRLLAPVVQRFIAVSRHMADDLCHTFAIPLEKIRVVHNAVAAPAAAQFDGGSEPGLNRGGTGLKVVLTPARLHAQKGHRYLLEAALLVPDAIFVFAGDGPERTSLEDQSARLGLRDRVLFLGRRDDIPALLAQCDVCVLPSLSEGLPLAVLEAMAAGKPVIACAVGGVPELVADGQTGLLVPPADPQALAGAIRCLLSNPGLARQLAAAGHARVLQDFSVSTMVARITAIYEELLEKTHARHRRAS